MSADAAPRWELSCTDAAGRARKLQVAVTRVGQVALIVPPGESAIFPPDQVARLVELLSQARRRALRGE